MEELSTYEYKQLIKANDRATKLNLAVGVNGHTLYSGILGEEVNGSGYHTVKLTSVEVMTIGYIVRKGIVIRPLGQKYLKVISKFKNKGLM